MTLYAVSLTKFDKVSNVFERVEPDICVNKDEAVELANYMINGEVSTHLEADRVNTTRYANSIARIRHMTGVCYGKFRRDSTYIDDEIAVIAAVQETEV